MRFIVDGMLGGLARWLRILGHEVVYERGETDTALLENAIRGRMTLLTGDKELFERASSRRATALLVTGLREEERIAEVTRKFAISLDADMEVSRCPECGAELEKTTPEQVSHDVPDASLRLYDQFWRCKNQSCSKVYWMGSHWRQITKTLEKAKKLAGS